MLVDSHSHLTSFGSLIPDVLAAARASGVGHVVVCGMKLDNSRQALDVAAAHPDMVSAAVGWHPWMVRAPLDDAVYAEYRALVRTNHTRIRTIGEIGLDYADGRDQRKDAQQEVFRAFVRLAGELGLPMTMHIRGAAHADAALILEEEQTPALKGALHGFDGSEAEARRYLELGLLIGAGRSLIGGPEHLPELFRALPLEKMLVETDGGYRPEREFNPTPAYVRDVAKRLAEIKGVSFAEVERHTTRNFEELIGATLS